jgi:hypothetical protein
MGRAYPKTIRKRKELMLVQDDCEILGAFDTALDVPNEDATQLFLFSAKCECFFTSGNCQKYEAEPQFRTSWTRWSRQ